MQRPLRVAGGATRRPTWRTHPGRVIVGSGVAVVALLAAVASLDPVSGWLSAESDALAAAWDALKTLLLLLAAVYAWREFVFKRDDRLDTRLSPTATITGVSRSTPRLLEIEVKIENVGNRVVRFDGGSRLGPSMALHFYDGEGAMAAVSHGPRWTQLVPAAHAYPRTQVFPFLQDEGRLSHEEVEPGATVVARALVAIPPAYEPVVAVHALLSVSGHELRWNTEASMILPRPEEAPWPESQKTP